MRVQLKARWGSHLPNSIVSVSPDRAKALEAGKVGKALDPYPKPPKREKYDGKKAESREKKDDAE